MPIYRLRQSKNHFIGPQNVVFPFCVLFVHCEKSLTELNSTIKIVFVELMDELEVVGVPLEVLFQDPPSGRV